MSGDEIGMIATLLVLGLLIVSMVLRIIEVVQERRADQD